MKVDFTILPSQNLLRYNFLRMQRKSLKRISRAATIIFVPVNPIAIFHAYKFTHFTDQESEKSKDPKKSLTVTPEIQTHIFCVSNPRPGNVLLSARRW